MLRLNTERKINLYISYITSDAYSPYCGISLTSLFENNKEMEDLEVFIVTYDLKDDNKKKFDILAEKYNRKLTFIDAMPVIDDLKVKYKIKDFSGTSIGYTRIFPHKLYPEYVNKILYIDSDTIIISSLAGVEEFDLCGCPFAMAENLSFEIMPELLRDNEKIAFYNKGKNYNSGVIICDIQKYLEAGIEGILIEELKKGETYAYAEQSIINCAVPFKFIKSLPLKYNYSLHRFSKYEIFDVIQYYGKIYSIEDMMDAEKEPIIIHYIGDRSRPWYRQAVTRRKKEYLDYKHISPWCAMESKSIFETKYFRDLPVVNKIVQIITIPLFNSRILYMYHRYRDRKKYNNVNSKGEKTNIRR